jgi:transcriptional regulator with XRE-family HTH domain
VRAVVDGMDSPRKETWLLWHCVRCDNHHQWLVPSGRKVEDTARESLKSSIAYHRSGKREDVYRRLSEAPQEKHRKILFGELIWWWREEAVAQFTQAEVAEAAGITVRQWIRIEAGESMPLEENLVGIIHAVDGVMDQAYLLTDLGKVWSKEMERRLADEEARLSEEALLQLDPEGYELQAWESPDVEVALKALKKVIPASFEADQFLFYAYTVHQEYWGRRGENPIRIDDDQTEIIPVIKDLFDLFERCENKQAQYRVVHLMARGAKRYMTKPVIMDLINYFVRNTFTSGMGEDDTRSRMGDKWNQLSAMEKLALTLFDLIGPQNQPRFIKACQKLQGSAKGIDHWLSE